MRNACFSVLPALAAIVPIGAQGSSEIVVDLVSREGNVVAEAKTTLVIATSQPSSPPRAAAPARPPQAGANTAEREQASISTARVWNWSNAATSMPARFFERAADMGLSQGAMASVTTYDPNELAKLKVVGLQANAAAARKWYDRAAELGAAEAGDRLRRLGAR